MENEEPTEGYVTEPWDEYAVNNSQVCDVCETAIPGALEGHSGFKLCGACAYQLEHE